MGIRDVGFLLLTTKGTEAPIPKIKNNLVLVNPLMAYPRKKGWEYYTFLRWDGHLHFLVNEWLTKLRSY